ncbi:hypothetical protein BDP55DRAFT_628118 [Colletotrichum godetiae]|uniref:Uncharacterized protein n=1 Tax=Colletotrichum godetiae TaxID=1209918 RepID=A0AAJ0AVP4_9PEZI|nr:uncharacterized protein BDP55DRAFT_628118 [Colletotrichum godetiae]KAK1690452.1 hypothetical protein BDP55DRAFT_628118 [Colletotrichum godetiae]
MAGEAVFGSHVAGKSNKQESGIGYVAAGLRELVQVGTPRCDHATEPAAQERIHADGEMSCNAAAVHRASDRHRRLREGGALCLAPPDMDPEHSTSSFVFLAVLFTREDSEAGQRRLRGCGPISGGRYCRPFPAGHVPDWDSGSLEISLSPLKRISTRVELFRKRRSRLLQSRREVFAPNGQRCSQGLRYGYPSSKFCQMRKQTKTPKNHSRRQQLTEGGAGMAPGGIPFCQEKQQQVSNDDKIQIMRRTNQRKAAGCSGLSSSLHKPHEPKFEL